MLESAKVQADLAQRERMQSTFFFAARELLNDLHCMRKAQKEYFKTRALATLTEAKKYEARIDKALAALAAEKNEPKLF